MKTVRVSKSEKAAVEFCASIVRNGGGDLSVKWSRAAHGDCHAAAVSNGVELDSARGCGYCKESTVLACSLMFLGDVATTRHGIIAKAGAGVAAVTGALAAIGWTLEETVRGRDFQGYRVTRSAV